MIGRLVVQGPNVQPPADDVRPADPPPRLEPHERGRLRAAAYRATQVYPGPVGQLISRELSAVDEWGYRFVRGSLLAELVDHVMKAAPRG